MVNFSPFIWILAVIILKVSLEIGKNKTTVHIRILPPTMDYKQMMFTFQFMYNFC